MKLPRGYGSVYKMPGKRRRPWIARKTSGWDVNVSTSKVIQKYVTIGYYETKKDALKALADYNENPYDIKTESITFEEVYEKWSYEHYEKISAGAVRTYTAAWKYCDQLKALRMKDVRPVHMETCIKTADVGNATRNRMKSLFNQLFAYSMKHDIVDRDYAAHVEVKTRSEKKKALHKPFKAKEIKKIHMISDSTWAKMVLIALYTGWRPQELALIKLSDVDLEEWTISGGMKTSAGKNRIVPVHTAVREYVAFFYDRATAAKADHLFYDYDNKNGKYTMTYNMIRYRFNTIMELAKMDHNMHDCRYSFITLAKEYGVDEYCLKLIVGHAISDVTEKVYTQRTIKQLHDEIAKIPGPDQL